MRITIVTLLFLAGVLVAIGIYTISSGRSPDEAAGGAFPIILAVVLVVVAGALALINALRR